MGVAHQNLSTEKKLQWNKNIFMYMLYTQETCVTHKKICRKNSWIPHKHDIYKICSPKIMKIVALKKNDGPLTLARWEGDFWFTREADHATGVLAGC